MQNYFIRNRETDKLELHFTKAAYQALSYDQKKEVKSYFIWSRTADAWVSKARLVGGQTTGYFPLQIAGKLGLTDNGEVGERMTELARLEKKNAKLDRQKAFYTDVDRGVYIDWEQYTPSDRLSQDHNSVSFYDHNYPASFKAEMNDVISDIKTRLKVSDEQDLPTPLKQAIERYARRYSEYLSRYVRNRTYAPSPMVVGPARYPWHKLDKAHVRDGKNFKDLDEAKDNLKKAVEKALPGTFEQRSDPYYLQNRIKEAQAQLNRAERGIKKGQYVEFYERIQAESKEVLAYWQDQVADQGGLKYSKQSLSDEQATHVKYGGRLYPIVRLNDKTVTIGKWFNDNPKNTFQIPYAKLSGSLQRWEDALISKPDQKGKVEADKPTLKVGDKAIYITPGYNRVELVTVKSVGRKYYHVGAYGNVPFADLQPVEGGAQDRLARLLEEAKPLKKEIIDSISNPDERTRYDIKHFLNYQTQVYRGNMELLHLDLQAAGYPKTGGLIAFFKAGLGSKKKANPAKNAKKRSASTSLKKARLSQVKTGKKKQVQAIERTAARRAAPVSSVKMYLDGDTNTYREKRKKADVKDDQLKRQAIKTNSVATDKPKLTKAQKAEIKAQAQSTVQAATGKKKELTADQVIKIGRKINFNRYHIVIDGKVYNVREDFDTAVTNKRRLAPTEANLIKWAAQPGRYDLIGVDAANKIDVTVFRKRDKNAVPKRIRLSVKSAALRSNTHANRKPGKRVSKAKK